MKKYIIRGYYLNFKNDPLTSHTQQLIDAAENFNKLSFAARNPKQLNIVEISDNYITLQLSSDSELGNPGKSLRVFSTGCLAFLKLYGKNIFKFVREDFFEDESETIDVFNAETLKVSNENHCCDSHDWRYCTILHLLEELYGKHSKKYKKIAEIMESDDR